LSAAIAAGLGNGRTLEDSVSTAKTFVWEAIREASMGFS
jgi:hydroxymethylpyrimidine/phosphomethylpyrimidine kinase